VLRATLLRASASPVLRRVAQQASAHRIAERFVAGDTLEDALEATRALARAGASVTIEQLGEDVTDVHEARAAAAVVRALLDRVAGEGLPAGVTVKPKQLGLRLDPALCRGLLGGIAAAAEPIGAHVTLDMEGSDVTEWTVQLAEQLHADGLQAVGCALQAYLRRTPQDLERLTAAGASVRLSRGAYSEPPEIAHQGRAAVDERFADCADWLLEHGVYPRLATHDHRLIARALNTAARLGLEPGEFELEMSYGVRTSLQRSLVRDGWQLRVHVPFGGQWQPYLMRRLAERPANVALFLRSLRDS